MPSDYYVKIDGVEGESKAQGMSNNIELESFSFGASNPAQIGGGGLSAGKASLSDFSFTSLLDSSSAPLLNNLFKGQHINSVVFTGRKSGSGATPVTFLTVTMNKCYVTGFSTGGGSTGVPSQSVSLAFQEIKYEYKVQTDTGATQAKGAATYDIAKVQQS
jgi:type VI secretion system secreted protein Hcp